MQQLVRSTSIRQFDTFYKNYEVSFDIKPTGQFFDWSSVLHVSRGNNYGAYGDRIPGVWFIANTYRLHICSAVNNNVNYCYNTRQNLPTNKFSTVRIVQKFVNGGYRYSISIDGNELHSVVNNNPITIPNVKAYAADPWYVAAKALIKNIVIKTSPGEGKLVLLYFYR